MKNQNNMATVEKHYNKEQCVYGPDSTMHCMFCSATCKERYEDFKKRGVKVVFVPTKSEEE